VRTFVKNAARDQKSDRFHCSTKAWFMALGTLQLNAHEQVRCRGDNLGRRDTSHVAVGKDEQGREGYCRPSPSEVSRSVTISCQPAVLV